MLRTDQPLRHEGKVRRREKSKAELRLVFLYGGDLLATLVIEVVELRQIGVVHELEFAVLADRKLVLLDWEVRSKKIL